MKKDDVVVPLGSSLLITRLLESGTGVIEGNYKASLALDDIKTCSEKNLSVHLSDLAGNYLGKYYLAFTKPKKRSISCQLLTSNGGEVFNQLKRTGDWISVILLPFKYDRGGYAGRFIADWGGPTAEVDREDLNV